MALKCKYPAFAKMSWPPSPSSNRLWKDGAKCFGIMLVLCDETDCFCYKPTIVKQCLKEVKHKLCTFVQHTENKWLSFTTWCEHTLFFTSCLLSSCFLLSSPEQLIRLKTEDWYFIEASFSVHVAQIQMCLICLIGFMKAHERCFVKAVNQVQTC